MVIMAVFGALYCVYIVMRARSMDKSSEPQIAYSITVIVANTSIIIVLAFSAIYQHFKIKN